MKKTEKSLKFMEHNKDDQYAHYRVSRMKRERKIAESLSEKIMALNSLDFGQDVDIQI